jgi:hypothetical protein
MEGGGGGEGVGGVVCVIQFVPHDSAHKFTFKATI